MSAKPPTLILGAAIGYDQASLDNFLSSLARIGYRGRLVLFVAPGGPPLDGRGLDVSFVPASPADSAENSLLPAIRRHFELRRYLAGSAPSGSILLTDVRDVVFQADPFDTDLLQRFDLLHPLEERLIGDCPINTHWIERRYGRGILDRMRGEVVSCCGTVVGSARGVREYLDKMCAHLVDAPPVVGIDQGVHNYIVHLDPVRNQAALLNGLGPIMTMHYMRSVRLTDAGLVANYDGSFPAIVHQYDRLSPDAQGRIGAVLRPIPRA